MRAVVAVVAALAAGGSVAHAQGADVPALIKVIEQQPDNVDDRSAWKEQRRDAARKLIASKDKRAVPVMIKLAETETFDVIGEIAIEGLGTLGDKSAVPVLQRVAADNSRDRAQRELARKALKKLGASETGGAGAGATTTAPTTTTTAPTTTTTTAPTTTGSTATTTDPDPAATEPDPTTEPDAGADVGLSTGLGSLVGTRTADLPTGPTLSDDTIAAYDRLTFAIGSAHLSYDSTRNLTSFDADVAGRWQHRIERERMAWGIDGSARVVTGLVNPPGADSSRAAVVDLKAAGEARFYAGKVYGIGQGVIASDTSYISTADGLKDTRFSADFQLALGAGYGRSLDVGAALRVRRIATVLDRARALGRPIDPSLARRLQLTWWA